MHNQNEAFLHLNDALPADIARRRDMGDLAGALQLIDARLSSGVQPLLAPRLEAERLRLTRLPYDYPYTRPEAVALVRAEWPGFTEAQFDALLDGGRIDWRMVDGELRVHREFLESLRIYPKEAPGLVHEAVDNAERDAVLARMEREGSLTARITLKADIRALVPVAGQEVQAWLPLPAACPQQSNIELLDCTPGGVAAPEYAPQRTMWWKTNGVGEFSVTYRYLFRAEYTAPMSLSLELAQPDFDLEEQPPHIVFTPYLRALAARLTEGCANPAEKAKAIYDYVTGQVDYRYQPAYLQLDCIADQCAKTLRGDCGVFALLFITLCRIAGIPARWQSGLAVRPGRVGPHDWAMFYLAPHGWLWADCSFGSSARRSGEDAPHARLAARPLRQPVRRADGGRPRAGRPRAGVGPRAAGFHPAVTELYAKSASGIFQRRFVCLKKCTFTNEIVALPSVKYSTEIRRYQLHFNIDFPAFPPF